MLNKTIPFESLPKVFMMEDNQPIELPTNYQGEYFVPEPDLNMIAIELVNNQIENYYQRSRQMDSNWQKAMAQSCIQQIITILQENL